MWAKALAKASWSSLSPAFGGAPVLDAPEVLAEAVALALEAGRFPAAPGLTPGTTVRRPWVPFRVGSLLSPSKRYRSRAARFSGVSRRKGWFPPMEGNWLTLLSKEVPSFRYTVS